jgi:hypothetical protein
MDFSSKIFITRHFNVLHDKNCTNSGSAKEEAIITGLLLLLFAENRHSYSRIRIQFQNWRLNVCYILRRFVFQEASQDMSADRKSSVVVALFPLDYEKRKAVPLQAWSGPEGSRKLSFPDFMTTAQDGGKGVSLTHRPHLPPGNTPSTYFC